MSFISFILKWYNTGKEKTIGFDLTIISLKLLQVYGVHRSLQKDSIKLNETLSNMLKNCMQ